MDHSLGLEDLEAAERNLVADNFGRTAEAGHVQHNLLKHDCREPGQSAPIAAGHQRQHSWLHRPRKSKTRFYLRALAVAAVRAFESC